MSSASSSDRNLLFGILALQMDFISRDALIQGMHAWVMQKARPLGEILVEQGALSASRQGLLTPLVEEHIRQHDNDPQKSLEAVSSIGSVRQDLGRIADQDVHASVGHVGAAARAEADSFPTVGGSTPSPSVGPRYRRLRPHARGGLGEVFVALDEELHREVALKEIQNQHADHQDSQARFVLEAEVTGNLEHPGIVPIYGLGCYEDGRLASSAPRLRWSIWTRTATCPSCATARTTEPSAPG